jgi:ribose 5-phosphate isomerase A
MSAALLDTNWIPSTFQEAAKSLARNAVKRFVKKGLVVGLGSGPMAAAIVREMAHFDGKDKLDCIVTSFQIKLEAECSGLRIADESSLPEVDIVFDGADEVDSNLNMIKGGGGALLREKIVHSTAKQIVIAAESQKFVPSFTWPVPIEVHPFAVHVVRKRLHDLRGIPKIRMLKEGYPYVTENGNFILDTSLKIEPNIRQQEADLKGIPGVIEVGLFTRHANVYYKAKEDGAFDVIENT